MSKITLKPAHDRRVVDPATRKPLPAEGDTVTRNVYWLRRLREGDVIEVTQKSMFPSAPSLKPAVKLK